MLKMLKTIKLTPFVLFLLLLIVLVISVVFGKIVSTEGFVSFAQSTPSMQTITIPQYSAANSVYKLYDNVFFDNTNSNLIEVDGTTYSGNVDVNGSSITTTYVTSRDGTSSVYQTQLQGNSVIPQSTDKSVISSTSASYKSWIYPTQSKNTDSYTVFYMPWMTDTYIHILDNTSKMNIETAMFSGNQTTVTPINAPIGITGYVADSDMNNGKMVTDSFYDPSKQLFQISKYVKFDISNANLVIQKGDSSNKSLTIYDRYGNATSVLNANQISNTGSNITNVTFKPFMVVDACGQYMVLYIPKGQNTMISLIQYSDGTLSSFNLGNVCRFNPSGFDNGSGNTSTGNAVASSSSSATSITSSDGKINISLSANDIYKFWNTLGPQILKTGSNAPSDDYILKTQIVPPVCPSCPACSTCSGTCTSCGGQGGSGTLTAGGTSLVNPNNPACLSGNALACSASQTSNYVPSGGNIVNTVGSALGNTVNAAGNIAGNTVNAAGNIAGNTVDVAGNIVGKSIGAVGNVATTTLGTATNILKTAETDVASLLPKFSLPSVNGQGQGQGGQPLVVQGQSQVIRDQKGLRDPLTPDQIKQLQGPGYMGTNTQAASSDNYYGALPTKSGNFIPITSSFAAFGK